MCLHPKLPVGGARQCPDCGVFVCRYLGPDKVLPGEVDDDPGPFDTTDEECPDVADSEDAPAGCAPEALALVRQRLDDLETWAQVSGEAGAGEVLARRRGAAS